jgi:antitoxin (DNA-binding transcriptional repressor) of toxin-antitoxin stability system
VITDEKWPVARLIPISSASGVEAQERRLASALLAVSVMGATGNTNRGGKPELVAQELRRFFA